MKAQQWQTEYPTLATVQEAAFQTLDTWCECLPHPQTDVERCVWRRLHALRDQRAGEQVREASPEIADKMNRVRELLEKVTGVKQPRW